MILSVMMAADYKSFCVIPREKHCCYLYLYTFCSTVILPYRIMVKHTFLKPSVGGEEVNIIVYTQKHDKALSVL